MKTTKLLPFVICLSLLLVMFGPAYAAPAGAQESEDPVPERQGLRADAPPYAVRGPFPVGVREFLIEAAGEGERDLKTTLWYPAQNDWGVAERHTYSTGSKIGFEFGNLPALGVYGRALENAPATSDRDPGAHGAKAFPLFVYSHGHGGFRQEAPYLTEQLASHGFVVIAVDHRDSWGGFPNPALAPDEYWRPAEVTRAIDFAEDLSAEGGALEGMIDLEMIAVGGYSTGGGTALASGGARLDLASFGAWCEENTVDEEPPEEHCTTVVGNQEALAESAGLDGVPEGLWPDWSDPRVDAVIALASGLWAIGTDGIQGVSVPTLFVIGGADNAVGPGYWPYEPFANVASERKAQVVLDHAGHMVFWEDCEDFPGMADLGWHFACMEAVWDKDRAHDLINHFATAFLLTELKADTEAAQSLAPDAVTFSGIEYESEGYATLLSTPPP